MKKSAVFCAIFALFIAFAAIPLYAEIRAVPPAKTYTFESLEELVKSGLYLETDADGKEIVKWRYSYSDGWKIIGALPPPDRITTESYQEHESRKWTTRYEHVLFNPVLLNGKVRNLKVAVRLHMGTVSALTPELVEQLQNGAEVEAETELFVPPNLMQNVDAELILILLKINGAEIRPWLEPKK